MISLALKVIFIFLLLYVVVTTIVYFEQKEKNSLKVNFKTFRSWYYVNPERYRLRDSSIAMILEGEPKNKVELIQMSNPLEQRKYEWFRHSLKKKEYQRKMNKKHIRALETVQRDIDTLRGKVEQEQKEAIRLQNQVLQNLSNS